MATAATIKKNIAKLEAALKSKATPKSLKSKLETQLVKSKAELSGLNKGRKPKTSSTKSTQSALKNLKDLVNKNKKYKNYKGAGVDLERDADRPAKPIGRRTAKASGKTYYEYRANRIDVKQPPKRYPKLEKGGYMAKGGSIRTLYKQFNQEKPNILLIMIADDVASDFMREKFDKTVDWSKLSDSEKEKYNEDYRVNKTSFENYLMSEFVKLYYSDDSIKEKCKGSSHKTIDSIKSVMKDLAKKYPQDKYAKGGYMAKGGKLAEFLVTLTDEDGYEDDVIVMAKDEDDAVYKAEQLRGYESSENGVVMLTDYDGNKIEYAKGGSLSSIKEEYDENEDNNAHSENVVLLAKHFGTKEDLVEAKRILDLHEKEGHLRSENGKKRQELHLKLIEKARTAMDKEGIEFAKGGYMAKGGYFAKGGAMEHGLKRGDTIIDDMSWDKSVKVLNNKTGYAVVNLETGERKEMKAMGGEMHRTQE